jgi:hypothetical protein
MSVNCDDAQAPLVVSTASALLVTVETDFVTAGSSLWPI